MIPGATALTRTLAAASSFIEAALDQDRQQRGYLHVRLQSNAGGDIDDVTVLVLRHVGGSLLRGIEEAVQIGGDDGLHIGFGVIGDRLGNEDAGVVDQHIDLAELGDSLIKDGLGGFRLGDIAGDRQEIGRTSPLHCGWPSFR
jgi:hypothetical protein